MAGKTADYPGGTNINSMKYFGVYIVSAGMITAPDNSYEVLVTNHEDIYKKLILKNGLITGMVFSGEVDRAGIIYNLMRDAVNVDSFKQSLVTDDVGLLSLPEKLWRNRLATATVVNGNGNSIN
jgi:NAD(P)H-nitrite reductase large subunit